MGSQRPYVYVLIISVLLNLVFVMVLFSIDPRFNIFYTRPEIPPVKTSLQPLGTGGLLFISLAVNDISRSLNKKTSPGLPPIRFYDVNTSYRVANSWMAAGEDLILVFLFSDIPGLLTREEIEAYATHEVCHVKLGHIRNKTHEARRNIAEEITADTCAVESGVGADVLISAIVKLSAETDDVTGRIGYLGQFIK